MKSKEFAEIVGGKLLNLNGDKDIKGFSTDSRNIKDNSLFIPIIGEKVDGHDFFTEEMAERGIISLWNNDRTKPENLPVIIVDDTKKALYKVANFILEQSNAKVIGISGSNGKTSVKNYLSSILSTEYKVHSNKGNLNTDIGISLTLLEMPKDTEYAVIEMGIDHFGEMNLLTEIAPPTHFILTNVGEAHLDDLISREGIAKAKTEFLNNFRGGYVLYNFAEKLFEEALKSRNADFKAIIKSFGVSENSDFVLEISENNFRFTNPETDCFSIKELGKHQIINAAEATAFALLLNVKEENIRKGLENSEAASFRTELVKGKKTDYLNDAYKSNPSALRAGLETFYSLKGYNKKIAVIGDMLGIGIEAWKYHYDIGAELNPDEINLVFTLGDLAFELHKGASGKFKERAVHFEEREEMIKALNNEIEENTLIFLKASNSERFYEIPDEIESLS